MNVFELSGGNERMRGSPSFAIVGGGRVRLLEASHGTKGTWAHPPLSHLLSLKHVPKTSTLRLINLFLLAAFQVRAIALWYMKW